VYIPLIHRPGDEAQVDFFEVTVEEGGIVRKAWKFVMRLMYSGRDFVWLYDGCDQLCFLDAHVRAFGFFGAVPRRVVYDYVPRNIIILMCPCSSEPLCHKADLENYAT
jgi:transposase